MLFIDYVSQLAYFVAQTNSHDSDSDLMDFRHFEISISHVDLVQEEKGRIFFNIADSVFRRAPGSIRRNYIENRFSFRSGALFSIWNIQPPQNRFQNPWEDSIADILKFLMLFMRK